MWKVMEYMCWEQKQGKKTKRKSDARAAVKGRAVRGTQKQQRM